MPEVQVVERKLAAIFAADVVGYSHLIQLDELGTLRALRASRAIIDRLIADYRGRIFTTDFMYTWYKFSPDSDLSTIGTVPGGAPYVPGPLKVDSSFAKGKAGR